MYAINMLMLAYFLSSSESNFLTTLTPTGELDSEATFNKGILGRNSTVNLPNFNSIKVNDHNN